MRHITSHGSRHMYVHTFERVHSSYPEYYVPWHPAVLVLEEVLDVFARVFQRPMDQDEDGVGSGADELVEFGVVRVPALFCMLVELFGRRAAEGAFVNDVLVPQHVVAVLLQQADRGVARVKEQVLAHRHRDLEVGLLLEQIANAVPLLRILRLQLPLLAEDAIRHRGHALVHCVEDLDAQAFLAGEAVRRQLNHVAAAARVQVGAAQRGVRLLERLCAAEVEHRVAVEEVADERLERGGEQHLRRGRPRPLRPLELRRLREHGEGLHVVAVAVREKHGLRSERLDRQAGVEDEAPLRQVVARGVG
mmetsp:Transcript_22389/g.55686  ORF Transcript_22389/g.55686 Transcript_22389/m.55686 type:complete len:306 (-) Transcript_22389:136-1053(-)